MDSDCDLEEGNDYLVNKNSQMGERRKAKEKESTLRGMTIILKIKDLRFQIQAMKIQN